MRMLIYTGVDLSKILGGHEVRTIGDNWWHHRRFRCYIIHINWCVFFTVPYISHATISLVIKRKKFAFLQLPVLEPIFSATWVLILALKINVLREMTFNLTLVSTTTVHIAAYIWPTINWNRLNSCLSGGRSARLLPAHQQCIAIACS